MQSNYRIVRDSFLGYEVQKQNENGEWIQIRGHDGKPTNTYVFLWSAKRWARKHARNAEACGEVVWEGKLP